MSSKEALDKNNKYDRQLRLWGDHGQSALESAKVCLINATATGTEILKNLILPGVGSFTIVDGNKVSGEDAGNNFFLCKDSIGKSRAQTATEYLSELNDDVSGHFVEESVERLLDSDPLFFNNFTIVIATNLPERVRLNLADVLWRENIPLLICRCYGFIGYMRLIVREHTVIESHPDSAHEDLRLDKPFPGLISYCDSLDLGTMKKKDHSHTPWLVLVYKYLQQWKQEHNGENPHNYREKNQLKDLIRSGILKNKEGVPEEEENFDEAIAQLNTALVPTRIHAKILHLFDDEACKCLHSDSKLFWILTRAIKEFVDNEGKGSVNPIATKRGYVVDYTVRKQHDNEVTRSKVMVTDNPETGVTFNSAKSCDLPLRGTIPDMTADSERYVQLQNVYRNKAKDDVDIVTKHLHTLLENIGRVPVVITERDVKTFCRNAAFLRVLRTRSLAQEYDKDTFLSHEIAGYFEDEEQDEVVYYTLLRAVDKFYDEYNRYPGFYDHQVEADIRLVKSFVNKLLQDWGDAGCSVAINDDYIYEICRYGASELHSIASFLGGAAAQEVIKIITGQFVPIDNTFIYNGLKQTSVTVQL